MKNGTLLQYFHWYYPADCSLWKKLVADTGYLQSLGISAVWLPPAYKGIDGDKSVGYDTYDLFDLGEFDQKGSVNTRYGSKEAYRQAVEAAQNAGIKVYVDIVVNHKGGADEREKFNVVRVDPDNRTVVQGDPFEIEAYTKFTFPNRQGQYSSFVWDFHSFSGVDYAADLDETGIFKIINEYGTDWDDVISDEFGNFDYLMHADIEFRNPAVREELKYWIEWYYKTIPFDGLRLDAVKHIVPSFFNEWLDHARQFIQKELFVVAECWSTSDIDMLHRYIEATGGRTQLFDSLLQNRFHIASKQGRDFDLDTILTGTLVGTRPEFAVTLVANHDTQPLQSLEAPVEPWFKPLAYAIILLRKDGYPCLFYPDLFGAEYKDKGDDGKEYDIHMPIVDKIDLLLKARQQFAYGDQQDIFDHNNCIAWLRHGDDEHPGCITILSNGDDGFKDIQMGEDKKGWTYTDYLGNCTDPITIDEHGNGRFYVKGGSVSVWVKKE
jgi:alpha-amylase